MDPFTQAARRFSARKVAFWKVRRIPVLRAVAADGSDLVDALRWEEAQPGCRRLLIIAGEPFAAERPYFEGVTGRILEAYAALRAAGAAAGVSLAEVTATESPEPIAAAVSTAHVVAAALPAELDGLAVLLCPSKGPPASEWAVQVERLLRTATALSPARAGDRAIPVQWIVHDVPGGPLAGALGEGVDLRLDEEALFTWWRDAGKRSGAESVALREHLAAGAEALRANDPDRAVVSFQAARAVCAAVGRAVEESALWVAIAGAQLAAQAPEDAVASYRAATALAQAAKAPSLACQAKLGEAGVLFFENRCRDAEPAYVEAARLAETAGAGALRAEALRMAGLCRRLAAGGREMPQSGPLAETPGYTGQPPPAPPATGADPDATLAPRIAMPHRVLPFAAGDVDPGWLGSMSAEAAAERACRPPPECMDTVPLSPAIDIGYPERVLPFEEIGGEERYRTQPLTPGPPRRPLPFVAAAVDPASLRSPDGKTE